MTEQFALEKYQFNHTNVRVLLDEHNDPWFIAKDVCDVLGLDTTHVRRTLDEDEVTDMSNLPNWQIGGISTILDQSNGGRVPLIVSEAGLYKLIMRSRKENAKPFQRWVTHEVLPTIRKHGAYMSEQTIEQALASPDFLIKLATQLKNEQEARKQAEAQLEQAQPKVLFADCVSGSKTSILVGELAKILTSNGVKIGQNNLFQWMRDNGYLGTSGNRYNIPTVKALAWASWRSKNDPTGQATTWKPHAHPKSLEKGKSTSSTSSSARKLQKENR